MTAEQNIGKRAQNFQVIALDLSDERTIDKPYEIPIEGTIVALSPSAVGVYEVDVRFVNDRSRVFTATPPMTLQAGSVIRGIPFHRLVITHKAQNATAQIIVSQDDGLNLDFGDAAAVNFAAPEGIGVFPHPNFPDNFSPAALEHTVGERQAKNLAPQLWNLETQSVSEETNNYTVPAMSWGSATLIILRVILESSWLPPQNHRIIKQIGARIGCAIQIVGGAGNFSGYIAVASVQVAQQNGPAGINVPFEAFTGVTPAAFTASVGFVTADVRTKEIFCIDGLEIEPGTNYSISIAIYANAYNAALTNRQFNYNLVAHMDIFSLNFPK